jgi:hypothetical protein
MSDNPNAGERGRFSSQRKTTAVLWLLRGEDLELVSRELGVTAATLSGWRDDFLAGGHAALKSRPADDRDDELARLRAKVGELTMDNELLLQRCRADALREFRRRSNDQWLIERHGFRTPSQARADALATSRQLDAAPPGRKLG